METANQRPSFIAGVIEGFYGQPWSSEERHGLFAQMSALRLNTYLYAPKDDLKHRSAWRELYSESEAGTMKRLVADCSAAGVRFVYGISPGLTIRYSSPEDLACLRARLSQMSSLGCGDFALLFDDIPDFMDPADLERWGSLASAQAHVANCLFGELCQKHPECLLLFCPTPYCGRMAASGLGGEGYLEALGRELDPHIEVFWTGQEIISETIRPEDVSPVNVLLRREVVIWDNLHANDYDGRRFYCGPYDGRPIALKSHVRGILLNPNSEFPLNFVPFLTFSRWLAEPQAWDSRAAYLGTLQQWLPQFDVSGAQATWSDLVLFCDCFYLPHKLGEHAAEFYSRVRALFGMPASAWDRSEAQALRQQASRLQRTCAVFSDLRARNLFYALHRRIWELREELDLLVRFIGAGLADPGKECRSDFHLPGTYRGGITALLQRLLEQREDGAFTVRQEQATHE